LGLSGLSFQHCDILDPNLECSVNLLNSHYWTVPDLVASNYPFKIFPGQIIELGVQRSCDLCILVTRFTQCNVYMYMICHYVISTLYHLLEELQMRTLLEKILFWCNSSHNFTLKRNELR
jgi:hypothetical protein